jgi:nucleoside-diphosphate kinase
MKKETVLILLKPDVMAKGLTGYVIDRFSQTGLELLAMKIVKVSKDLAEEHYRHLKGQPFFDEIVNYLQGSLHGRQKVVALVYEGARAIAICRKTAGATNPEEAHPKSIRGSVGRVTTQGVYENVVHVSSDRKEARREIALWFSPEEIGKDIYPVKIEKSKSCQKKGWK